MKASPIKTPTFFLQAVIALAGIAALAFLLWEPHVEGVNAHATTLSEIYFDDPFLAYAYIASIPFFVVLYQAFRLAGYAGRNRSFSFASVKSLRMIRYCAMAMIPLIAIGVVWLLSGESDDRPPIPGMGVITTLLSIIVAAAASVFEKLLQHAVRIQSEHDGTV